MKIEDLVEINKRIEILPNTEPLKKSVYFKTKDFLNSHKVYQDIVVVSAIRGVIGLFAYLSVTYLFIAKEIVYGSSVVLFVGLSTIYFRKKK